ncbi:MAG: hypothetical protein RLZZ182_640 [Pseudomonadota bacterium]|jgi:hypothetical protein
MAVLFDTRTGPVTSVVNYWSAGGIGALAMPASSLSIGNLKETLSGAVTGGTFVTIINVSGRGRLNFACAKTKDATNRTVSLKLTIDGTVAFNAATAAVASSDFGLIGIGCARGGNEVIYQPIDFQSSMKIEITQSLSETDKVSAMYNYEVWA